MSEGSKGIEALKKIASEVDACIELGIKIGKDGVNREDIAHAPAVIERVKSIIALIPDMKEAEAELKDIDLAEIIDLAVHAAKEVQD